VDEHTVVRPREARNDDLLIVHSKSYLENLKVCLFDFAFVLIYTFKYHGNTVVELNCSVMKMDHVLI